MDFIVKKHIVWLSIKPLVVKFLQLLVLAYVVSKLLKADKFIVGLFVENTRILEIFQPYSLLIFLAFVLFTIYIVYLHFTVLVISLVNPQLHYNDALGIKYLDLPAIPNHAEVYRFMELSDKYLQVGRADDSFYSDNGIDKYGNLND